MSMRGVLAKCRAGDQGFAMISVVLFGVILLSVTLMTVTQVQQATHRGTGHVSFEREIHLAETGVDQVLARLQQENDWSNATVGLCEGLSAGDEKVCAKAALDAVPDTSLVTSDGGQYAVVKPAGRNVLYAAGWAPSRAAAGRTRVVKVEYLFSTYTPANAVLSNGTLTIGGNAAVNGALGNVHANGDIDVVGGALSVSGSLTATGTVTNGQAGWLGGQAPQEVPEVNPRSIYSKFATDPEYSSNWYDLCPDGSVRAPSSSGPCTGGLLASSGGLRGWQYQAGKWTNDRQPYDGIYYVYQRSASIKGTDTAWHATILAEPTGTDGDLDEGDIEMTGKPILQGLLPDIALVAGRDLDIQGTGNGDGEYEGLLGAHEQFKVTGNPTLTGAIIGETNVDSPGSPVSSNYVSGSMVITHEVGLEADLGGLVRTTLWLEL
jgi:hypothetical protein